MSCVHFGIVMSSTIFALKTMFVRLYSQLFVRALMSYLLFVFDRVQWCPTRLDIISKMAGVLLEVGTAYPSRAPGFIPGF